MPQCLFRPLCGRVLVFVALLVALVAMFASPQWSHAQIATDGSLGPARTLSGKSVTIGSDLGQIRGANLFHSFLEFNVNTGQSVTFTGPTSIANILSRVTGGSPSTIDGLLRSTIPGANMFLLNPAGVLFGPNASLDIGGSFHVTTADYVRLRDGGVFHANLANQSVLSVASPAAFGFLGTSPAPIIVQGSALAVGAGRSISLVGGDVAVVNGLLAAPGGRISLVSVGGAGEATFNPATQTPDLSVRNGVPGGQVVLSNAGLLSDSDVRGGRILIRGGRLVSEASVGLVRNLGVEDGDPVGIDINVTNDVVLDGSALRTATLFARGGDIAVNARSIVVAGGGDIGTLSFGPGAAGAVRLSAETLDVRSDLSSIFSRSTATGDSGAISIVARLLNVDGGMIRSETADGRGGDVVIDAARVVLAAGGGVESFTTGSGTGASLTIRASESVTASGTSSLGLRSHVSSIGAGRGPAGPVTISTPMLAFDGADVSVLTSAGGGDIFLDVARAMLTANAFVSSINEGAAPGGNVTFIGSQSIRITGESSVGSFSAGSGLPGRLEIRVPVLSLENASNIGSPGTAARAGDVVVRVDELSILGGSQITTGTLGAGSGGTVTITARQSMTMAGRSDEGNQSNVNSITAGSGNAGDIAITTPALSMTDSASITTATVGPGKGGNVTVNVGRLRMSGDAFIDSTAISDGGPSTGPAGTVTVNASEAVSLARGAAITALTNNAANAGTVTVSAPTLSIAGDATITGTTAGAGRGGDIRVNVGQLQLSSGGSIDSTAQAAGRGGTVTVTADTASIIGRDPTSGRPSRLSSNSQASGPGGDVVLRAGSILLQDGGSVQARAFGEGNAGNLTIAGDKLRSFGGSITTEAANGAGGNIVMRLTSLAQLVDSRVTTSVQGGFGSGGNITIAPRFLVLDGSEIRADAFGGPGGNVSLVADIFLSTDSVLSASSALGTPGVINVQAQITDVSGTLQSLPESVLQAATLLREACRVRAAEGPASSFVLGGRGGLPPAPGGLLPSPLLDDVPTASASMPAAVSFSPIVLTANCR